jgi:hypothetical protein
MVSTQVGRKWNSFVMNLYFQSLSSSAFFATLPSSIGSAVS